MSAKEKVEGVTPEVNGVDAAPAEKPAKKEKVKKEKVPKEPKEKKVVTTDYIKAFPEGITEKLTGKSKAIAEVLLEGNSKSEALEIMKGRYAAGEFTGAEFVHQTIFQVWSKLIKVEGVVVGQKEVTRAVKESTAVAE